MTPFSQAIRFTRVAPLEARGEIDAGWAQGAGAFGGLVAATLVHACSAEAPRDQPLVGLGCVFTAPATPGPATVRSEVVRAGRNVSTLRTSLMRDQATLATALATFARSRDGGLAHDALPMPEAPAPDEVPDGPEEHYFPAFARAFAFRQCLGPRPFSGGSTARVGGWCRIEEDDVPVDAALACALLDAWPPAAVALSPGWCPVASISIDYQFFHALPLARGEPRPWLFHAASCTYVDGGLADESAVLWSREGKPLATARQRIAMFPRTERSRGV